MKDVFNLLMETFSMIRLREYFSPNQINTEQFKIRFWYYVNHTNNLKISQIYDL